MKNLLLTFLVSLFCLLPLGVAASPPADAPIPTMGKLCGAATVGASGSGGCF